MIYDIQLLYIFDNGILDILENESLGDDLHQQLHNLYAHKIED